MSYARGLVRRLFSGQDVSWDEQTGLSVDTFFQEIAAQGIAPLLFHKIRLANSLSYPPALLLSRLRETALHQAATEMLIEANLRSLLNAFAENGISPLILKGTALAYTLYPEPWLRPRCDTDLLITESERDKASALLLRLGYKPLLEATEAHLGSQMSYSKVEQGIRLGFDLHWQISNTNSRFSTMFTNSSVFADTSAIPSLGKHARTLNRVAALLYACFHRAGHFSHSGDRLIWLYDIHLLCQALTETEAESFSVNAKQLEITALCADALSVAQSWFNTTLSAPLVTLTQSTIDGESFACLLQPGGRRVGIKNHALLELRAESSWPKRIRFLVQNAFPPPKYMLWRYNKKEKSSLPLLYCRRFIEAVSIFLKTK